jgi:hypothetical protein
MPDRSSSSLSWPLIIAVLAMALVSVSSAAADQPTQTTPEPGFRPDQYCVPGFTDTLDSATVAVLPTIVRRVERTAHSFASQQQIVAFLAEMGIDASKRPRRVDLGPIRRHSQWEMFQYGARTVSESLEAYDTGTDYTLAMEILVPQSQAVFGIEIYIVDQAGKHALSFLLNSHHTVFTDAKLVARNSSEDARNAMIDKATSVGLAALEEQLGQLREDDCQLLSR